MRLVKTSDRWNGSPHTGGTASESTRSRSSRGSGGSIRTSSSSVSGNDMACHVPGSGWASVSRFSTRRFWRSTPRRTRSMYWRRLSPAGRSAWSSSRSPRMVARGVRISCAMRAAMPPRKASWSARRICSRMRRFAEAGEWVIAGRQGKGPCLRQDGLAPVGLEGQPEKRLGRGVKGYEGGRGPEEEHALGKPGQNVAVADEPVHGQGEPVDRRVEHAQLVPHRGRLPPHAGLVIQTRRQRLRLLDDAPDAPGQVQADDEAADGREGAGHRGAGEEKHGELSGLRA